MLQDVWNNKSAFWEEEPGETDGCMFWVEGSKREKERTRVTHSKGSWAHIVL